MQREGDMTKAVYRYEVPVDDQVHTIKLTSNPLAVAAKRQGFITYIVEFWAECTEYPIARHFRVYGTGQPIPDAAKWWGTARVDGLVWHLFEERPPTN
jgi:hypothetical protein